MRPFRIYPASFDGNALGYWRFGERGGSLAGVVGPTLTINGTPTPLDDGYRFAGADQYLQGAFAGQPARAALTLECWIRAWTTAEGTLGTPAWYYFSGGNTILLIRALRHATPASSYIEGAYYDNTLFTARWTGAAADAILAGAARWHAAVVHVKRSPLRFFVNGALVVSSPTTPVSSARDGDYTLRLGQRTDGTSPAACILDEVRLSASARYTANFPVVRFGEGRRLGLRGPGILATAGGMP